MSRLLYAGFARLRKDPLFWIGMVLMFLLGVFLMVAGGQNYIYLDDILFAYLMVIGFMCAIFCSYFTGREYHDGTIRNKLIAGHTRTEIYLSHLIINVTASLCLCISTLFSECVFGLFLKIGFQKNAGQIPGVLFGSALTVIAFCSIFTLIAMLDQSKSASDVICIILACVLLFSGLYLMETMSEIDQFLKEMGTEEEWEEYMDKLEGEVREEYVKYFNDLKQDPIYQKVQNRNVYEFAYEFLPSGQCIQYATMNVKHPKRLLLYSVGIILVTTIFGNLVLQRKNIR